MACTGNVTSDTEFVPICSRPTPAACGNTFATGMVDVVATVTGRILDTLLVVTVVVAVYATAK